MNAIATTTSAPMPVRSDVSIRVATLADLPFMDGLQKRHSKQLGYFPTKQFEGYIEQGGVLIAEENVNCGMLNVEGSGGVERLRHSTLHTPHSPARVGYIISKDRYLKRDELGVVYQLCVAPGNQRKLVGAALVKAVFERSAYGCKLYCCWCAQDLGANHFWESMGFVPIAFRAGSDRKKRVHIFWQRRINADDVTTPYWYPCQTSGGAIGDGRLVFPIPPGVHWKDVHAVAAPAAGGETKALPSRESKPRKKPVVVPPRVVTTAACRLHFGHVAPAPEAAKERPKREKKPKAKLDPALVSKTRELRDRYLERVNENPAALASNAKYEVTRSLGPVEALRPLLAA